MLDVKFGQAALYKDLKSAKELAHLLVRTLRKVLPGKVKHFADITWVVLYHLSTRGNQEASKHRKKRPKMLQVNVGNGLGIRTGAVLSCMNGTIGRCVGNSLEVIESLETLKGRGPDDLMELVNTLGNHINHHP